MVKQKQEKKEETKGKKEEKINLCICKVCWRPFPETQMAKNTAGKASNMCSICADIIGGDIEDKDVVSPEETEKWLEEAGERREKYYRKMREDRNE